jgi:hypothetical protein
LLSETFSTLSALRPPSNPRTNNVWRSLPPSDPESGQEAGAGRRKPTLDQVGDKDIEMSSTTTPKPDIPIPITDTKQADERQEEEGPDWNLFHALQSTRGAMGDLRQSAKTPRLGDFGEDELRRIDREVGRNLGANRNISVNGSNTAS